MFRSSIRLLNELFTSSIRAFNEMFRFCERELLQCRCSGYPGIDWWRTEFTLFKGNLFWRTVDIPANWAENVGSSYSVTCSEGQKLYVNFDALTGEVK